MYCNEKIQENEQIVVKRVETSVALIAYKGSLLPAIAYDVIISYRSFTCIRHQEMLHYFNNQSIRNFISSL